MSEWIKCSDRLPEEGVKVLTYLQWDDEYKLNYIVNCPHPIWACVLEREEYKVTNWMELPPKPQNE